MSYYSSEVGGQAWREWRARAGDVECPPETLSTLSEDTDSTVRTAVAGNPSTRQRVLEAMVERFQTQEFLNSTSAGGAYWGRITRVPPERLALASNPVLGSNMELARDRHPNVRARAASNIFTSGQALDRLCRDFTGQVRSKAALNPNLAPSQLAALINDPILQVRINAAKHLDADLTPEEQKQHERDVAATRARKTKDYDELSPEIIGCLVTDLRPSVVRKALQSTSLSIQALLALIPSRRNDLIEEAAQRILTQNLVERLSDQDFELLASWPTPTIRPLVEADVRWAIVSAVALPNCLYTDPVMIKVHREAIAEAIEKSQTIAGAYEEYHEENGWSYSDHLAGYADFSADLAPHELLTRADCDSCLLDGFGPDIHRYGPTFSDEIQRKRWELDLPRGTLELYKHWLMDRSKTPPDAVSDALRYHPDDRYRVHYVHDNANRVQPRNQGEFDGSELKNLDREFSPWSKTIRKTNDVPDRLRESLGPFVQGKEAEALIRFWSKTATPPPAAMHPMLLALGGKEGFKAVATAIDAPLWMNDIFVSDGQRVMFNPDISVPQELYLALRTDSRLHRGVRELPKLGLMRGDQPDYATAVAAFDASDPLALAALSWHPSEVIRIIALMNPQCPTEVIKEHIHDHSIRAAQVGFNIESDTYYTSCFRVAIAHAARWNLLVYRSGTVSPYYGPAKWRERLRTIEHDLPTSDPYSLALLLPTLTRKRKSLAAALAIISQSKQPKPLFDMLEQTKEGSKPWHLLAGALAINPHTTIKQRSQFLTSVHPWLRAQVSLNEKLTTKELNALSCDSHELVTAVAQDVADQRMDPSAVVLKEFSWSNPKKRLFEDYTLEAIDPSTSVERLRELASAGWPWLVSFHPSLPQRDQRSFKKRRPSEVELAAIAATSNARVINFVVSKGSRSKSHRLAARAVAANPHITKRASVTLAKSSRPELRGILANNPGISPQARMILSGDEYIWIRRAIEDSSAAATDAKNFVDLFTFKSLNTDQ